ncbi:hypothetical protein [Nonomuraea indica]|uniref:Uncharacterized protein n=1 Tax=Nonomuraea indica TaxID=1581193 RepID=A0ABW8A2I8_9ACTN
MFAVGEGGVAESGRDPAGEVSSLSRPGTGSPVAAGHGGMAGVSETGAGHTCMPAAAAVNPGGGSQRGVPGAGPAGGSSAYQSYGAASAAGTSQGWAA